MNQDCNERNESVLNWNVYLSSPNVNDKDITNDKTRGSKIEITIGDDPYDGRNDSVHNDKVVHNEPGDNLIVSDQGSNKTIHKSSNSIPKGKNIKNLTLQCYLQLSLL